MIRTILSHDTATTLARVRFEHAGVTLEQDIQCDMILPGTRKIFADFGVEFDEAKQLVALDKLTAQIERQIDAGEITNPPGA